jgi:hypothetical protein
VTSSLTPPVMHLSRQPGRSDQPSPQTAGWSPCTPPTSPTAAPPACGPGRPAPRCADQTVTWSGGWTTTTTWCGPKVRPGGRARIRRCAEREAAGTGRRRSNRSVAGGAAWDGAARGDRALSRCRSGRIGTGRWWAGTPEPGRGHGRPRHSLVDHRMGFHSDRGQSGTHPSTRPAHSPDESGQLRRARKTASPPKQAYGQVDGRRRVQPQERPRGRHTAGRHGRSRFGGAVFLGTRLRRVSPIVSPTFLHHGSPAAGCQS